VGGECSLVIFEGMLFLGGFCLVCFVIGSCGSVDFGGALIRCGCVGLGVEWGWFL